MLKFRLLAAFLFIAQMGFSQRLDMTKIKAAVTDSTSAYFYPKLLTEFLLEPDYYSGEKGTYLYYGNIFSQYYKAFFSGEDVDKFNQHLTSKNYATAIEVGEKLLEENPLNLGLLLKMSHCYKEVGNSKEAMEIRKLVDILMRAIRDNGDKPYKVISVSDEYIMMSAEGLTGIARNTKNSSKASKKIPRTQAQGISAMLDSWEAKDNRTNENKIVHFEVLYSDSAF